MKGAEGESVPHGDGEMTYQNGDVYVGAWKEGKRHGQGKYTYATGVAYVGAWEKDEKHGQGKMTYASGNEYVGSWKKGQWHGQGKYTYADGRVYVGAWEKDERHGQGKYTFADGDVYDGAWWKDKKHGQGEKTYASGNVYDGAWEEGEKHGIGVMRFADGNVYVGEWKGDVRHIGTLTAKNGTAFVGRFEFHPNPGRESYTTFDGVHFSADRKEARRLEEHIEGDGLEGETSIAVAAAATYLQDEFGLTVPPPREMVRRAWRLQPSLPRPRASSPPRPRVCPLGLTARLRFARRTAYEGLLWRRPLRRRDEGGQAPRRRHDLLLQRLCRGRAVRDGQSRGRGRVVERRPPDGLAPQGRQEGRGERSQGSRGRSRFARPARAAATENGARYFRRRACCCLRARSYRRRCSPERRRLPEARDV